MVYSAPLLLLSIMTSIMACIMSIMTRIVACIMSIMTCIMVCIMSITICIMACLSSHYSLLCQVDYSIGGTWTTLYSSSKHGFSMNRFQHHCSDYRHPSVLVLTCHNSGENRRYTFVLALDTEWR